MTFTSREQYAAACRLFWILYINWQNFNFGWQKKKLRIYGFLLYNFNLILLNTNSMYSLIAAVLSCSRLSEYYYCEINFQGTKIESSLEWGVEKINGFSDPERESVCSDKVSVWGIS